jgi:type VI secretion system protein ImpK
MQGEGMSERIGAPVASGDADATVLLPTPGRKRSPYAPSLERPAAAADLAALGGLNPLVEAANPILAVVPQIRHALRHPDPAGLRARVREQLDGFERGAQAAGIADERFLVARYALCVLLDDSAAATPWGRDWAARGLAAELHPEAGGSEKFFVLLEEMLARRVEYPDLLAFFYVCLALGFEGKYRGGEGGRQALAQIRARVHESLGAQRTAASSELSGRWQGCVTPAQRAPGALGIWATASVCLLALAGMYFGYAISLGALSDPVASRLARLKPAPLAERAATLAAASIKPAAPGLLTRELASEISRGAIAVADSAGATLIVLKTDELFGSGSARLNAELHPLIARIADALNKVPGTIVVTGHTDDVPIRTARFPSNWELSTERARSVAGLMSSHLREPGRLRAEGVADSDPIAPNDTAANRARNRRVAIHFRGAP